jgi:4-amino-4-deoxy-L-arabinose transferase-like glycosyltransferase
MTIDASERAYARAAFLLVLLGTALHLAYSTHLELVGDEAYYWLWSRRPDISYVDKGPMVAWFIRAGTGLFGQTVFGVRFFAAILAGGTGVGLYWLGKKLFSSRVGFWAILLASVMPLFFVGASLMTIDTVYVFFWTWAALAFWRAKDEARLRWWVLTGMLVGLGLLSKYTAALELFSFAAFCFWHRPSRVHFRRPTFWMMTFVALLFLIPAVVWNIREDWPTTHWLVRRGALNEHFSLHPSYVLSFLGNQAGIASPLLFLALIFSLCRPGLLCTGQPASGYAVALFLPIFGLYLLLSIHYLEPPNWPAAAYIGGVVLLAAKGIELADHHRWVRWAAVAVIGLAVVESSMLMETRWLHLSPRVDPLDRARGSKSLAASVAQIKQQTAAQFIIADNYMTAALLSFYLPGQPEVFVPITGHPLNQLEVWPSYEQIHPSGNALFVTKRRRVPRSVKSRSTWIEPLGVTSVNDHGRTIARYHLFLCGRPSVKAGTM